MKTEQELRLIALDYARGLQKEHDETLEIAEAYFKFLSQATEVVTSSTMTDQELRKWCVEKASNSHHNSDICTTACEIYQFYTNQMLPQK